MAQRKVGMTVGELIDALAEQDRTARAVTATVITGAAIGIASAPVQRVYRLNNSREVIIEGDRE